ncbi:hydroxyethylthiazole kinase [Scopulibacillus daqui]|uniref:Hydroxyethylthiazole kinase n=1 Tax=Scopulibacillus daqui TaxID=1469162 RepID=A0ABS2Q0X8_9BACL|nr:hydroxyethylthiazole kinase [Scopulibacillus daqui]MBM7645959.1 hydroxyethylthiazole kinase [Scopulibacillus daqui]
MEQIYELFNKIKDKQPLVHHITNSVTMNDCANAVLALGGRPVMADSPNEAAEMAAQSSSLVINIGTLAEETVELMLKAGKAANEKGIPVIFDPVGVGATQFRSQSAKTILANIDCSIICGNMSEIRALAGLPSSGQGVDSGDSMDGAEELAKELAGELKATIAITGAIDAVSDGERTVRIQNGHPMLASLTGTGCMTNSLIGVFAGTENKPFEAAAAGILAMGLAGEKAYRHLAANEGAGMFRVRLFDALSTLAVEDLKKGARING